MGTKVREIIPPSPSASRGSCAICVPLKPGRVREETLSRVARRVIVRDGVAEIWLREGFTRADLT